MRRKRRKSAGFTIIECLISIAILAISLTGVLAALAYDAFSAGQAGHYTFAVNYSRKLMDLLQSGQLGDPSVSPNGCQQILAGPPFNPPDVNSNPDNDGVNWHNLDGATTVNPDNVLATGGGEVDFWGPVGSLERRRFDTEKQLYGVNYCWHRLVPKASITGDDDRFQNQLIEFIVTTRWHVRTGFRSVQLRSLYVTTPEP